VEGRRELTVVGRVASALSFRNASALWIFVGLFALFAVWVPDTFLTSTTWKTLLNEQAVTAILALAIVLPLSAGMFDLSVGASLGLGAILVAWLLEDQGASIPVAIGLTLVAGAAVGAANALLVLRARIDSFIATLGVSSLLGAIIIWISDSNQILGLSDRFRAIADSELFGVQYAVYYMLLLAVVLWYFLERTPSGRRVYATGGNPDAARLSGVRTRLIVGVAFTACGVIAVGAGIVLTSKLGTGDPTVGAGYLLPAFSAAFLGSTQFRNGRFNVAGTVVAVYVLAVGIKGLQLAGAPAWIPEFFNGAALLVAVGMSRFERNSLRTRPIRRLRRRKQPV
jgi:ribose transport system permease protein